MTKIKILYLAANPTDTGHLQLQEEARDLEDRISQGIYRDKFEVVHCLAVRPRDLLRGLQVTQPHILHFSGHGNYDREIVFQGDDGTSQPIAPQDLADLVKLFKTNLKVVLLSCCFGQRQAVALQHVVDFTIGMDKPISDKGAVHYSAAFYQVLASGGSVRQAFEAARLITMMEGQPVFEKSDLFIGADAVADEPLINVLPGHQVDQKRAPAQSNHTTAELTDVIAEIINIQTGHHNQANSKSGN
jgi:hypothetical protein